MLGLLSGLVLAASSITTTPNRDCDDECQVLVAALEWAIGQVPQEHRSRTIVDLGRARNPPTGESTTLIREQNLALTTVAARLGVPTARKEEDERFQRCIEPPAFAACHEGTTWITVRRARLVTDDEAVAAVEQIVEVAPGQRIPTGGSVKELRLRRTGGVWAVTDSKVILWIN